MNHETQSGDGSWFGSPRSLVLIVFLAIVGFFLLTEHRAHLFGILPFLLLLACPFRLNPLRVRKEIRFRPHAR